MVDFSCMLAAVCFMAANVMKIIYYIKERNRPFDWDQYRSLDPTYLDEDWKFRLSQQGLFLSSGFLNGFAWVVLASPIIQMAWLLSKQGTQSVGVNTTIIVLAIGGALTEWLSNLFWIGSNIASKNMVTKFELYTWLPTGTTTTTTPDGLGWKTLEVNHIVSSGFIWLTDSFEWLCLGLLFLATFVSIRRWRQYDRTSFGGRWNGLTLFMSLICLAEFVAQVLRFEGFRTAGRISLVYGLLNRLILMPAWIISLGVQLPRAAQKIDFNTGYPSSVTRDQDLQLMEMNSAVEPGTNPFGQGNGAAAAPGTNPFSIDDGEEQAPGVAGPPPNAFAK